MSCSCLGSRKDSRDNMSPSIGDTSAAAQIHPPSSSSRKTLPQPQFGYEFVAPCDFSTTASSGSDGSTRKDEPNKGRSFFFLRHAESMANVVDYAGGENKLLDPALSPLGEEECKRLGTYLYEKMCSGPQTTKKIRLLVSPLRRTFHTADLVFGPIMADRERFSVSADIFPDLRETHPRVSNWGIVSQADFDALEQDKEAAPDPTELSAFFLKFAPSVEVAKARLAAWNKVCENEEHMIDPDRLFAVRTAILEAVAKADVDEEVVVVSHWGLINAFGNAFASGWAVSDTEAMAYTRRDSTDAGVPDPGAETGAASHDSDNHEAGPQHNYGKPSSERDGGDRKGGSGDALLSRVTVPGDAALLKADRYGKRIWRDFQKPRTVSASSEMLEETNDAGPAVSDGRVTSEKQEVPHVRCYDLLNLSLTKMWLPLKIG
ncbi:unnamed protein product [Amoebophrya sp. A25]|nr:unnamed protein product [Amoebophrya sp. A25]|eukprot:GSA25T00005711001.1